MPLLTTEIIQVAIQTVHQTLSTPSGMVALGSAGVASVLMLAGSFVKTMIPLRWLAVGSNLGFMVYGLLLPNLPMLILHALLVPINVYRAFEVVMLTRRVSKAWHSGDTSLLWMLPYMKQRKLKPGTVLFHKGDRAHHLFMLVSGRMELVEIGAELPHGRIFGEIGLFSADHRQRTLTARSVDACQVLGIADTTILQLCAQNRAAAAGMIGLILTRMGRDVDRLETELAQLEGREARLRTPG